ncbi:MAG: hypothetical protein NTX06_01400, partial [Proteobacteria bacterium]|nr:hypothetical protein [Pseudomonadota bacterium]
LCFVCPCYILASETGNDVMPIARTARATLTKSSPVRIWLYYFEKCSKMYCTDRWHGVDDEA